MKSENILFKEFSLNFSGFKERILTICSLLVILIITSYLNYYIFHGAAEIFSFSIAAAIFMFSVNTYKITNNNFFVLLGIGYLFVAVLDMMHTFSFWNTAIFTDGTGYTVKFWIVARSVEAMTFLIASLSLYKNDYKLKYNFVFFVYFIITTFVIIDILYSHILIPAVLVEDMHMTQFKKNCEYTIMFAFFLSSLLIYDSRKILNSTLFLCLLASLIIKIITEFIFTLYTDFSDILFLIGHLLKVCSYYLIYIGVIENVITRPFDLLNYNLREASNKYKEKEEQRRYLEEVIIQNEYCYDLIIDNSCNCIFITRNEKIIYANATAVNTFGTSKSSSIIGKNTREIICTDANIDKILEKFKENINSSKFIEILELKDFDGSKLKFEYSVNNIIYRGSPAYLIVLKNISQKEEIKLLKNDLIESEEKLDRLNELNKITTEFFCNISHELKTPINIILGAIQIIFQNGKEAASSFSEKQIQLLNIMKQNTYRLIRLVNNLIDISKCEVDYLILDKHNYNIVSIVEDITLSVCEFYKMKGINIIFDTDTEEKIMAADADKIERIILNLLSNSIKFTDKGGQVSVSFTDMGEFVRISVKDTGIGIPDDKIKLIFDRFEQVDKTLTRKREGSGIGLALVKKLVELHGGSINVVSKLSEGSEFIIELPVTVIDDEKIETSDFENKVDKINIEFSDIYSDD